MRLLIDTDAFCKLAAAGLLGAAARLLGAECSTCGRLPALPYMLRRGRLRAAYGAQTCGALIRVAEAMPAMAQPSTAWLEKLAPIAAIDPGEAQIFAAAAENRLTIMSGDKRALRALKEVRCLAEALAGRVVVLEAILVALCDDLGLDEVRRRITRAGLPDKMIHVCFSAGNVDPRGALLSYYGSFADELRPLVLWDPRVGGIT